MTKFAWLIHYVFWGIALKTLLDLRRLFAQNVVRRAETQITAGHIAELNDAWKNLHRFRTPIAEIKGVAEAATRMDMPETHRNLFHSIASSADVLLHMTNGLGGNGSTEAK